MYKRNTFPAIDNRNGKRLKGKYWVLCGRMFELVPLHGGRGGGILDTFNIIWRIFSRLVTTMFIDNCPY